MSFFTWLRIKVKDAFLEGIGDAMDTLSISADPYRDKQPPSLEWMNTDDGPPEVVIEAKTANGSLIRSRGRRRKTT